MTIPAHVESTPLVYTINGEDRTAFVQFNPRPSFESTVTNALDKFQFTWYDPDQTLVPGVWQDVSITMDGTAIFGGKITNVSSSTLRSSGDAAVYAVEAFSWGIVLERTTANDAYRDISDGQLITTLVAKYLPVYDATTYVEDAGITFVRRVVSRRSIADVLREMCLLTGYSWYVDADKAVHYFPDLTNAAPFGLSDAPNNTTSFAFAKGSLAIREDATTIRNQIYVYGGNEPQPRTRQLFQGDGTTLFFTTAYQAYDVAAVIYAPGFDPLRVGTVGTHEFSDGYDALIDTEQRVLSFPSTAPLPYYGGSSNLLLYYGYDLPVIVRRQNVSSHITYGSVWFDHVIVDAGIHATSEAVDIADAQLAEHSYAAVSGQVKCYRSGLRAGQRIRIINSTTGVDDYYLIQSVTMKAYSLWYFEYDVKFGAYNPTLLSLLRNLYDRQQVDFEYDDSETLRDFVSTRSGLTLAGTFTYETSESADNIYGFGIWDTALWG